MDILASILLQQQIICLTPRVKASKGCSLVCSSLENTSPKTTSGEVNDVEFEGCLAGDGIRKTEATAVLLRVKTEDRRKLLVQRDEENEVEEEEDGKSLKDESVCFEEEKGKT
nr:hypothetical protein Iba_chr10aCG14660 [Ipomoea batatas]